jgi:L-lactate dehydrogenase complex protein LldF
LQIAAARPFLTKRCPTIRQLRQWAHDVKKHTLNHLDYYLEQLERNVTARGGKVIWARDGKDANEFIWARPRARRENHRQIEVDDLGRNSFQRSFRGRGNRTGRDRSGRVHHAARRRETVPHHRSALHKTREDVADLFTKHLHVARETVVEKQTAIARVALREKFLEAGMGITGANFLVADSGAIIVVENEGNARLSSSAPKIHVAVAGIEKLVPRAQDLAAFLKLLDRSATGQPLSVYTSLLAGPRRAGEPDGPDEFYLVLLDNGRTKLLADAGKRESLYCIRCGACLNHCPVYRKIGGHSYPWVYSGPIGKIITPQFMGVQKDPWLPFASSLCGAVRRSLPGQDRSSENPADATPGSHRDAHARRVEPERAYCVSHVGLGDAPPASVRKNVGGGIGICSRVPRDCWRSDPVKAWLSQREMPPTPKQSFRELWKDRK